MAGPGAGRGSGAGPAGMAPPPATGTGRVASGTPLPTTTPPGGNDASWDDVIRSIAVDEGYDPDLALAVAHTESSLNPNAIGKPTKTGERAKGLFQLMPKTAADLGVNRDDPIENIRGGVRYLRQLDQRYGGDSDKFLSAYNAGPENVDKGIIPAETRAYVAKVQGLLLQSLTDPGRYPAAASARAGGAGPGATQAGGAPPPSGMPTDPLLGAIKGGVGAVEGLVRSFDPRTPEGRLNAVATAGSLAGGLGLPALAGRVGLAARAAYPVIGSMLGAGTAAAGETAAENAAGTSNKSPAEAALEQGALDAAGSAMAGLIRWPLKRLVAGPVAHAAKDAVAGQLAETEAKGAVEVAALKERNRLAKQAEAQAIEAQRVAQTEAAHASRQLAKDAVRTQTTAALADADLKAQARIADLERMSDRLNAPSVLQVGSDAADVLTGPVRAARDIAGKRVAAAAVGGPAVPVAGVQAQLSDIIKQAYPGSVYGQTSKAAEDAIGFISRMPAGAQQKIAAQLGGGEGPDAVTAGIAKAFNLSPEHPLPGLLGRIQKMSGAPIPFEEAHALKEQLDAAVNWDRSSRSVLERVTKGVRSSLRDAMRGYQPYDEAATAYARISKLWESKAGRSIMSAARKDPSALAQALKPDDPHGAQVIKDLLVTQAAAADVVPVTRVVRPGETVASTSPTTWFHGGHLDPSRAAQVNDMYTSGAGRIERGYIPKDQVSSSTARQNTDEFGNAIFDAPSASVRASFGATPGIQGAAESGQQAWNGVRSAFTYDHIISGTGGVEGLGQRLAKLSTDNPDFVRVVFGDAEGQAVLKNLQQIGDALTMAKVDHKIATETAKREGRAALRTAEEQGAAGLRDAAAETRQATLAASARNAARAADVSALRGSVAAETDAVRAQQKSLTEGSLGRYAGPRNPDLQAMGWKWAMIRRALTGPTGADLVQWASLSPWYTRAMVHAIMSPAWTSADAAFLRMGLKAVQNTPQPEP